MNHEFLQNVKAKDVVAAAMVECPCNVPVAAVGRRRSGFRASDGFRRCPVIFLLVHLAE